MKDLFSGSLGRLNNKGGSRMFTTPHTINVPPEYEVETDVPSVAEFVTCTLDGRLWVFRRSRRYYITVFRWDEDTQRLVFVSTIILSNINIIGRGIDWILTDTMIIQASDDEPYISTANLFEGSETTFLYSALRYKELTSGIDSFTGEVWGMSEDTGNSEGYGYFNRTALLQSVNKHYSLLPAIGDWHIIKNFLVRKADNPLSEAHNSMLNIRPLIPLEIVGHGASYGCGFDNDISLICFNGELWGRGLYNIARCYILPAVFDENGNPQEFYLYISPDYPVLLNMYNKLLTAVKDSQIDFEAAYAELETFAAEWLKMGIFHMDENVYGFIHEQADSLDSGLCYSSYAPKLFVPSASEWLNFSDDEQSESEEEQQTSEDKQMFIDTLNNSGLVLSDKGATFLNGDNPSYECKGLRQWLDPAGKVEAITPDTVISSWDNTALATHIQQGFYRELLAGKKLSITAKSFDGKRLSLGIANKNNVKSIQVNSIAGTINTEPTIAWENVYKQAVDIRLLNFFPLEKGSHISSWDDVALYRDDFHPILFPLYPNFFLGQTGDSIETYCYIHPVSGELISFAIDLYNDGDNMHEIPAKNVLPSNLQIYTDGIYFAYRQYFSNSYYHTYFKYMCPIPSEIINWRKNSSLDGLSLNSVQIPKNIPQNVTCSASAVFIEKYSNIIFLCDIPSAFKCTNGSTSGALAGGVLAGTSNLYWYIDNFWNTDSLSDDETYYTQGLHLAMVINKDNNDKYIFVFRSEIHPEIFDFKSEAERSVLS